MMVGKIYFYEKHINVFIVSVTVKPMKSPVLTPEKRFMNKQVEVKSVNLKK